MPIIGHYHVTMYKHHECCVCSLIFVSFNGRQSWWFSWKKRNLPFFNHLFLGFFRHLFLKIWKKKQQQQQQHTFYIYIRMWWWLLPLAGFVVLILLDNPTAHNNKTWQLNNNSRHVYPHRQLVKNQLRTRVESRIVQLLCNIYIGHKKRCTLCLLQLS